ncbi:MULTISPECIES: hypothetical protein [Auritidibacter]|uniref:hypothetical protein n=1 Tax=Auritidibacter TaxID=1160973 RepID=UPI000D72F813|nr:MULTISPECIES: hypothetical protein [Auritidibacter]AXR74125.1 hypothetical protein DCC27_007265 [Auritidibacter sp. NML130574]NIH71923.1 hypothetical protein [Auritidibacter ignavus]RMX22663.1 hypothetical protein DYI20_08550 [Auritidibacter ignavus]WHS34218.1 hypothetical protein QM403_07595 [Auritidibacter ignavus]
MKGSIIRRATGVGLVVATAFGTSGCMFINDQATTMDYAPSDGVQVEVSDMAIRNLALVSDEPNGAGRFIGSLDNRSDAEATVTIKVGSDSATWTVPAGERIALEDDENAVVIDNTTGAPGEMVDSEVESMGDSADLQVSVLDGTLQEYRQFVPQEDFDPEENVEHLQDYEGPYSEDYEGH